MTKEINTYEELLEEFKLLDLLNSKDRDNDCNIIIENKKFIDELLSQNILKTGNYFSKLSNIQIFDIPYSGRYYELADHPHYFIFYPCKDQNAK